MYLVIYGEDSIRKQKQLCKRIFEFNKTDSEQANWLFSVTITIPVKMLYHLLNIVPGPGCQPVLFTY